LESVPKIRYIIGVGSNNNVFFGIEVLFIKYKSGEKYEK